MSNGDPDNGGSSEQDGGGGSDQLSIGRPLSGDAPATTTEHDADGWWGLESEAPAAAWKDAHSSHLENLLRVPSMHDSLESPPWEPSYELHVRGFGGLVSKDRNRYTLVGHDGRFVNRIEGTRAVTADYHGTRVRLDRTDSVAGRDRLAVESNASYEFKSRTLMMKGSITRNWQGAIMRLASMEGVICGGAMTRVVAGAAATLSGMMTGDVYGAIGRASGIRIYLAVLQYRAAQQAAWALGCWLRNTTFTIVPVTPVPQGPTPAGNAAKKMGRLSKTARKAGKATKKAVSGLRMTCPAIDIVLGLLTIPVALYGIGALLKSMVLSRNKIPPAGPPRVENRNSPITLEMYTSKTFT